MSKIQIWMPMKKIPTVTAQEKGIGRRKNGKPVVFEKQEVKELKILFMDSIGAAIERLKNLDGDLPDMPISGPVMLVTKWVWPADSKHPENTWKTSKPDTDNSLKLLKDAITALHVWNDDSQVASEHTEKFYDNNPGIFVEVSEL